MRRFALPLLCSSLVLGLGCERKPEGETTPPDPIVEAPPTPPAPPKLVVVVVVDQMRADYFDRFADQWTGGFAQLHAQGRVFTAARHAHALTETAPGHASIATGCHPSHHGIVANTWFDRALGEKVNAVDDAEATIFDNPEAGGISAAALLREGVGDWMQAADPAAIVISMSIKDRAAILMGGKHPDVALWYDDRFGGYTSSKYYSEQVPAWVTAYNQKDRAAALYGDVGWTLSREASAYASSRLETEPELVTTYSDYSLTKKFPHVIDVEGKAPRNVIRDTPFGDQMTLELALEAITAEGMGADAVPDLLMLSMSGGDYDGHRYGPYSAEIHDYYLRLDEALGAFIAELDGRLGQDYVLILTADHGVAPMPEHSDIETAGRFYVGTEIPPMIERVNAAMKLGADQRPTFAYGHGVELLFPEGVDEATRASYRAELAALMRARVELSDAWTRDELAGAESRNEYADIWRLSFYAPRSPDIIVQYAPGVTAYPNGTGHGTPYDYDQRVPLIIRGPGFAGTHAPRVDTVDIAPTIAALVGIAAPADIDGHPLPLGE